MRAFPLPHDKVFPPQKQRREDHRLRSGLCAFALFPEFKLSAAHGVAVLEIAIEEVED